MMMWGTTSPSAKLTDDSGSAFEAPLIGDCRLFRSLARNQPPCLLGLLQQYRHKADVPVASVNVRCWGRCGRRQRQSPSSNPTNVSVSAALKCQVEPAPLGISDR